MRKRLIAAGLILVLSSSLVVLFPEAVAFLRGGEEAPPPGVARAQRALVRVFVLEDTLGAAAWLREQAAAFEKAYAGARVHLRTVTAGEVASIGREGGAVAPDVLLFSMGALGDAALLAPLEPPGGLRAAARAAGVWEGAQYALPLCLSGYALAYKADAPAVTPAPTSLLGIRPTQAPAAPATQAPDAPDWPKLLSLPGKEAYALHAPAGAGAAALVSLGAPREIAPVPEDFLAAGSGAVYDAFAAGGVRAAVLTARQLRALTALQAQGKAFSFAAMAAGGYTDLALFGGISPGAGEAARAFLAHLTGEAAQRALSQYGLFSAREDLTLYGGDTPALRAVEAALCTALLMPRAFQAQDARAALESALLSAYRNGDSLESAVAPYR